MKINFKNIVKPNLEEGYIKNSSTLVTILLIISGITYNITKGYGTLVILIIALFIMVAKKLLTAKANKYFYDMYHAKELYQQTKNQEYLLFIDLSIKKIEKDINIFSNRAKKEISELGKYVSQHSNLG
jgi:hypothetical protein